MIILFRHAKPIIDYSSCNYDGAINRLNDYNSTFELKFDDLGSLYLNQPRSQNLVVQMKPMYNADNQLGLGFIHGTKCIEKFSTNNRFTYVGICY